MSTTSLYEPDEDEEASDSDVDNRDRRQGFPASSPPLQGLRIESSDESEAESRKTRQRSRSSKGLRSNAHRSRRREFTKDTIDSYRQLLQDMINDASGDPKSNEGEAHHPSQNGAVTWSSREKDVFFNVLARKGMDGIRDISNSIGTKSELEVLDYIKLLQSGLEHQHLLERHTRTIVLGDVPAAAELSQECCGALDEFAEISGLEEQAAEDALGRKAHHDNWIIDHERAEQIEQQLETQESSDNQAETSIALSAGLLNITKWIKLSERCFMNFGGSRIEENWVNMAYADESPSLTCDAFADFYALAVSITRRLVQSSIFFAMSRIRDISWGNREIAQVVKPRDVRAALDVLNMKSDAFDFWIGVARRCSLDVADIRHRKGWTTTYMSYDEVETALSGSIASREESASRHASEAQEEIVDEIAENNDEELSEVLSSPRSGSHTSLPDSEDGETAPDPEISEDTHAEHIDQQISKSEELRIWKLLGQQAPSGMEPSIKLEDSGRLQTPSLIESRKPTGARKRKEDLVDWRDSVLYRSEWEEYGYEIFEIEDTLDQNVRKRRRVEDTSHSKLRALQFRKWCENVDHDSNHEDERGQSRTGDTVTDAYENYTDENEDEDDASVDLSNGVMELDPASEASAHHMHEHDHDLNTHMEDHNEPEESHPASSSDHVQEAIDSQEGDLSPMSTAHLEDGTRLHSHFGSSISHEFHDSE
ncbi:hypothetical protein ANI_1_1590064 [Paecilomyces variotii No. 5]|uniref:Myb-like domain-containing protein n=1 Tax=Byssochlamys spectabilis (strain No. 5 / NBRC 109023) TaxID=1356009 RepID=V5I2S8_BYSSN|nr:hypothetical protein ANI_1_1590064 [Paecilomyces variotii No. 5]